MVEGLASVLEDCRETGKNQIAMSAVFQAYTGVSLSWSGKLCVLTLPVNTQHDRSVVGMQVKQNGSADQVLGEIPEEGNRPGANK